jgi:hypothetical protein
MIIDVLSARNVATDGNFYFEISLLLEDEG